MTIRAGRARNSDPVSVPRLCSLRQRGQPAVSRLPANAPSASRANRFQAVLVATSRSVSVNRGRGKASVEESHGGPGLEPFLMDKPRACPFCLCLDVRLLYGVADGAESFKCHDCGRTFHMPDVRTSAAAYASLDQQKIGRNETVH